MSLAYYFIVAFTLLKKKYPSLIINRELMVSSVVGCTNST